MRARNNVGLGMFVQLKDDEWLEKQRIAGKVAGRCIDLLVRLARTGSYSLLEMDKQASEFIRDNECQETFYGYRGFPSFCCHSVNRQLVHGIATDYRLESGDLYSCDLGATYKGAIGDTATTIIIGEAKNAEHTKLVRATKEALENAIGAIAIGKRLGVIGDTIWKYANDNGFSCVEKYGGHGINTDEDGTGIPHAFPFVSNKAQYDEGIRITPGLVIAIEPLLVIGKSNNTIVSEDGWTVICDDICAHEEHSIFVHSDRVEVITAREGE